MTRCQGTRRRTLQCASAALLAMTAVTGSAWAQAPPPAPDGLWEVLDAVELAPRVRPPASFLALRLDEDRLAELLADAPREVPGRVGSDVMISMPLPDGTFPLLGVADSPLMEAALAAEFPQLGSYALAGVEGSPTGRLTVGPAGVFALLHTAEGAVRVDPFPAADGTTVYLSYFHALRTDGADDFDHPHDEQVPHEPVPGTVPLTALQDQFQPLFAAAQAGDTLHVYRLAAATTGEFYESRDTGNGLLDVLFSLLVEVANVNALFEPELSVRLVLSLASLTVIYDDPNTDPFDNSDTPCDLRQANRDNSAAVLNDADYDIGFLFATQGGTGGSGCAWYNICETGAGVDHKAAGAGKLGLANNPLVGSATGLVAHESGHQLGAEHTFSGEDGSCTAVEFNQPSSVEPGSGTTIMSYRGNCDSDDVDTSTVGAGFYYNSHSFEQITDTVTTGNGSTCGTHQATGNQIPIVDAGPDVTIPRGTPFTLDGSAIDPDGDPLRFVWEQHDPAADRRAVDTDTGEGPLFRSVPPGSSTARTFPNLADILAGTQTKGELLPSLDRVVNPLTFRLTARDDRMGGGGVAYDTRLVTVQGDPFFLTSPDGGETLFAGCPLPVTWTVGGGSVAANVDLLFSENGGIDFDETLLASTPNDGAASAQVPCEITAQGRVEAAASDNVFFDISNGDFAVVPSPPTVEVSAVGGEVDESCELTVTFEATVTDDCGVDDGDVEVELVPADDNFTVGTPSIQVSQVDAQTVSVEGSVLVSDVSASPVILGIEVTAADACGAEGEDFAEAEIVDATPPEIDVSLSPGVLWPPNHKLRAVTASVVATDNCPGVSFVLTSLTSDEPDNGPADGNTVGDIQGADLGTADLGFRLRAERAGTGDGRTYTATYTATDASDNETVDSGVVNVPKAQGPPS